MSSPPYRLILPDGTMFTNTDGCSLFTLEEARVYARWMGGTVTPAQPLTNREERTMYNPHDVDDRLMLCMAEGTTLNGLPARICGWAQHDATIFQIETGWCARFPWETVTRVVVRNGGKFTADLA